MTNPLIPQGTLNRLRGAVGVIDNPQLNVAASNLGTEGISLARDNDASAYLPTLTGNVPSGAPYQTMTVSIHLLKTQNLAALWELQLLNNSTIGDLSVVTDADTLPDFPLVNCTIKQVSELSFNGSSAGYMVTVQGTYYINAELFQ